MNDTKKPSRDPEHAALERIPSMTDAAALRQLMINAKARGAIRVERAAFLRLCEVQPSAEPGSLEHDVWQSIFALEEMRSLETGRTTRLSRTRQKIGRDGEAKTVSDLTLKVEPSEGFNMLIELGHPELLFESIALRHADRFPEHVLTAARSRLQSVGVDPDAQAKD